MADRIYNALPMHKQFGALDPGRKHSDRGRRRLPRLLGRPAPERDGQGKSCPVWPGQPMTTHRGIEDPVAVESTDIRKEAAFVAAFRYLSNRISVFTALPIGSLDRITLGTKFAETGRNEGAMSPRPYAA